MAILASAAILGAANIFYPLTREAEGKAEKASPSAEVCCVARLRGDAQILEIMEQGIPLQTFDTTAWQNSLGQ